MPRGLLIDLAQIDLDHVAIGLDEIRQVNPQRFEMEQLSGINYVDWDRHVIVGFKDVTENEFWARGHFPGRPLMPGVIMLEAAAQLASFYIRRAYKTEKQVGLGGVTDTKFRAQVVPPCRLTIIETLKELRSRRQTCLAQGLVGDRLVFEATIIGLLI